MLGWGLQFPLHVTHVTKPKLLVARGTPTGLEPCQNEPATATSANQWLGVSPGIGPGVPAVANCLPKSDHCTMEAGGTPGSEIRQETALLRAQLCPVPRPSTTAVPWKDHG